MSRHSRSHLKRLPVLLALVLIVGCGLAMSDEDRLIRAAEAMENGDYRAAAIDARNVLQKDPDNIAARLLLGRSAAAMDDGVSAEKELRRAIGLGAVSADVAVDLARALLLQQKFDVVISEITIESATTEADRLALMHSRAQAYLGVNQPVLARDLYTDILASDSEDIDALLGIVASYAAENSFQQAREAMNQILSDHDDSPAAWITSGSLYYRDRSFEAAERDYQSALELAVQQHDRKNEIAAWIGLAEVRLGEDNLVAAKEAVDRLLELAPEAVATIYFDARVAYLEKDFSRAQQRSQQVLTVTPEYRPAQMLLGAAHLHVGNLAQAEMYLSAVVAAVPSNTAARKLLAETRLQLNRVEDAKEALRPILGGDDTDASTYGMAARASVESGNVDEAVEYLQRAVETNPGNSDLVLDLAGVLIAAGRTEEARAALEKISETSGRSEYRRELLNILADIRQGDNASALSAAEDILSRNPDDPQLLNLVGSINLSTGNYETARKHFVRLQSLDPGEITSQLNLARIAASEGKREEAETWLDSARKADASAIAPRITLGRLYLGRRDFGSAENVAKEALEVRDSIAELHNILGLAQRGQGEHKDSLRSFERAIELEPDNPNYRLNLARAHINTTNQGLARSVLEESFEQFPTHLKTGVLLSALSARMGDSGQAMAIAKALQERNPESGVPFVLEGELLAGRKLNQQAADAYDAALERSNDRETAVRAFRLRVMAASSDPYAPLLNYLAIRPADSEVRLILAQGYELAGRANKAVEEYEAVIQSSPDNLIALNNLAMVYLAEGDSRAEETARRAYDLAPDNGSVADTLGWIVLQSGSVEAGVDILRKAVELANGRPEVRFHLATGLVEMGSVDEARSILQELLASNEEFVSRKEAEKLLARL
ncbi:MAG: PEP-CTERM system TPR-repeat protein PrsT [Gammaproteobacteria bacterium]|nr:PEP-CTERM system TPR-repeat protein PrsT [Gammaproteobacteria bacterium]